MKQNTKRFAVAMALGLTICASASAQGILTTFDSYAPAGAPGYSSFATGVHVAGATSYSITASGFGGMYNAVPTVDGTLLDTIQFTVNLSGTNGGGPVSGPIVVLADADGTERGYAWYGQTTGVHVLTMLLSTPTFTGGAGGTPGFDLANINQFHLQDDPGAYLGTYTIEFQDLRLISSVPEPSTFALLGLGAAGLVMAYRRKN